MSCLSPRRSLPRRRGSDRPLRGCSPAPGVPPASGFHQLGVPPASGFTQPRGFHQLRGSSFGGSTSFGGPPTPDTRRRLRLRTTERAIRSWLTGRSRLQHIITLAAAGRIRLGYCCLILIAGRSGVGRLTHIGRIHPNSRGGAVCGATGYAAGKGSGSLLKLQPATPTQKDAGQRSEFVASSEPHTDKLDAAMTSSYSPYVFFEF